MCILCVATLHFLRTYRHTAGCCERPHGAPLPMLRRHSRHVVESSITKWRIQWWSEWNAFIPAALSARSLVCHALLDNAAVGTDPITRLSPFALAKLARPQDCIPLPCRVIYNYIIFSWVQWSVLHSAISKCLKGHSHLARIKLPTGNRLAIGCPTCSTKCETMAGLRSKQFHDTVGFSMMLCQKRLVQNDLQFHSLLTWFGSLDAASPSKPRCCQRKSQERQLLENTFCQSNGGCSQHAAIRYSLSESQLAEQLVGAFWKTPHGLRTCLWS